jgi:hypothetical protein
LHVHGRGARTDACGRSFAVLSTQVSAYETQSPTPGHVPRSACV